MLSEVKDPQPGAPFTAWMWLIFVSVGPAFSIFGFYRFWVGILEWRPDAFYLKRAELATIGLPALRPEEEIEPSQEALKLDRSQSLGWRDICVGLVYLVFGVLVASLAAW